MAESHLSGQVIGVAFDGTGFGTRRQNMGRRIPDRRISPASLAARICAMCLCLVATQLCVSPGAWRLSYLRDAFGQQVPD